MTTRTWRAIVRLRLYSELGTTGGFGAEEWQGMMHRRVSVAVRRGIGVRG